MCDCCLTQDNKIENVLQSRGHNKTLVGNCCLTQDKKIENVLQSRGLNKTLAGDLSNNYLLMFY
jgi:hypothetical protein